MTGWRTVSLEHFGASADGARLMQEFGFTAENVVAKAHESLQAAAGGDSPGCDIDLPTGTDTTPVDDDPGVVGF